MTEAGSELGPRRPGHGRLGPAVLTLALAGLVACAPTREQVVGRYQLQGDPQKAGVVWTLDSNGSFTAESSESPSASPAKGTWTYHRGSVFSDGRLLITTEFVSREYAVSELPGVGLAIVVDADKAIAFHKMGPAVSSKR
jgi:hypothetical protein